MLKNKLLSGRVKTTPAANVTSDRYDYLALDQAEPNLGTAAANGYVLTYNTSTDGNRLWAPGGLESNLAYAHANAAFNAANNAVDTWVRDAANSASSYANGAFAAANTADQRAVTSGDYANSAFAVANSGSSYANGAFSAANTADQKAVTSGSYANGAFAAANTADQRAVTSGDYANSAFSAANSSSSYANGAFGSANSSGLYANAAFATANLKFNTSGGTISGDVTVTGNLTVEGNTVIVNVSTLAVEDSLIQLAKNNTSDAVDIGFLGHYDTGSGNVHAGLIRRASDDSFYLFDNLTTEPISNVIDIANSSIATLRANLISNDVSIRGYDPINHTNNVFQVANSASSYANGAFAAANTADQRAVTSGVYANSAFGVANSASSYANGAFASANTADQRAVTSGSYANSAFGVANSASSYANGAFAAANTADQKAVTSGVYANSAYIHANAAFDAANNATDTWVRQAANSASSYANGAFAKANSANVLAQAAFDAANNATDTWVRNAANAASSYANGAFAAANTADQKAVSAGSYANSAYIHANAAFNTANAGSSDSWARIAVNSASSYANSGYIHANAAFNKANDSFNLINGAFGVSVTLDSFTGDNSCTTFTLTTTPSNENYTLITLNGITQHKSAYSLSGANITFSEAPNTNVAIDVVTFTSQAVDKVGVGITIDSFTGDNSCTTFTLTTTPVNENYTSVVIDGVTQLKTEYSLSGANVVFTEAPGTNTKIEVTTFTAQELQYVGIGVQLDTFTGDNTTTSFTLTGAPVSENYTIVNIDGLTQQKTAYSVSGTTLTFTEAPGTNTKIEVTSFTSSEVIFGTQSNAAYAHANAAFNAANNATDTWVRNAANSASSYANSAFGVANSASSYANGAFAAANTADQKAVTSGSYANSAFVVANSASSYANGAFAAANTADQRAVTSGSYANSAFVVANSASSYANGAFAAANNKLNLTGGTISGNLTITGDLIVEGNNVIVNVSTLSVEDSLIQLARNNITDAVDIGFIGHYNAGTGNLHSGLVRRAADDIFYLFDNYPIEPTTNVIDTSNAQFRLATLRANLTSDVVSIRGYDPINHTNNAYQVANSASSYANGAFSRANSAFDNSVVAELAAGSASLYANGAFAAANSASSYANGAFAAANTADQKAVSAGSYANSAFGVANSASSYGNGAFASANTAINNAAAASSYANSAFLVANNSLGIDAVQNTNITSASSYANGAFAAANTADQRAVTSGSYANSAYLHANAAFNAANTGSSSTDSFARNTANAASSYANGAFTAANTADQKAVTSGSYANSAYLHANAAFNAANSATGTVGTLAYTHANAAFNVANTAASGGQLIYVDAIDTFTSNGSNTVFTLSTTPTSANQIMVYIDGVYQQTSAYTLSGATLTMSEAVDANSSLQVRTFANTAPAHLGVTIDTFTGTGACTTFTLSTVPLSKNLTSIIIGGVPQLKSAYSITGSSLVFTGAPANNALIEVATYKGGGSYATSFTSIVDKFNGNGSQTTFTLSTRPNSENETFVFLNGVYQNKDTYSVSGANVVLTGTATSNDIIEVVTVAGSEMNVTSSRYNSRVYTANGVQTTFTISSGHTANSILVFENGVCQEPITDYTVSGTTLTFVGAPAANVKIQIRELPV